MKIVNDDTVLHLVDSNRFLAGLTLAGGVLCLSRLVVVLAHHSTQPGEIPGLSIGTAFFLFAFTILSRKGNFRFDKYARKLIWRRGGLFGQRGGEVPFDEIQEVVIEQKQLHAGDGSALSCRLVLLLPGAGNDAPLVMPTVGPPLQFRATWGAPKNMLPVSEGYRAGAQKNCEELAARIREVLRHPRG